MQIGFDNLAARRRRGVVVDRAWIAHGVKFNKLQQKLFRLRQFSLAFDRKDFEQ